MNKRTLLIAIVALVGLCTTNKGHAAATVEEINWSNYAKTVSDVADKDTYVYLYNTKAKKFMLIQFKIENKVAGEGFGFYEMEANYVLASKYKG